MFPSLTVFQEISFISLTYSLLLNLIHFPHLQSFGKSHSFPSLTVFHEISFMSPAYNISCNPIHFPHHLVFQEISFIPLTYSLSMNPIHFPHITSSVISSICTRKFAWWVLWKVSCLNHPIIQSTSVCATCLIQYTHTPVYTFSVINAKTITLKEESISVKMDYM